MKKIDFLKHRLARLKASKMNDNVEEIIYNKVSEKVYPIWNPAKISEKEFVFTNENDIEITTTIEKRFNFEYVVFLTVDGNVEDRRYLFSNLSIENGADFITNFIMSYTGL